jgi:hypothetical protein
MRTFNAAGLPANCATLGRVARAALEARRRGDALHVTGASPALRELLAFAGLAEALTLELEREPEEREKGLGVEEEGHLADLPVAELDDL